jgi:predicted enzyme related to lactoylglutathione lyase
MVVFGSGDQHIGGFVKAEWVNAGESPSVWFEVESIEAMLEKAVSAGGKVIEGKSDVPSVGWSATVGDLDGNRVGLVQFAK